MVSIILGSRSDSGLLGKCTDTLDSLGINWEMHIASAHRRPDLVEQIASGAAGRGIRVMIAMAGLSAALPGVVAAHTTLPVIGVPVDAGPLKGVDALLSMVQMPRGIPVATVAIGSAGAVNAALLAAAIIATTDGDVSEAIKDYRKEWQEK